MPVVWKTGPIKGICSASDICKNLWHPKYRKPPKLTVLRRTCSPEQTRRVKNQSRGAGGGFAEGNRMLWRHCSNRNVWVWTMPLTWQQQGILQLFSLQGDHPEIVWLNCCTLHCMQKRNPTPCKIRYLKTLECSSWSSLAPAGVTGLLQRHTAREPLAEVLGPRCLVFFLIGCFGFVPDPCEVLWEAGMWTERWRRARMTFRSACANISCQLWLLSHRQHSSQILLPRLLILQPSLRAVV